MEETKRLQAIDGGRCEQYVHPTVGGKTPLGAFLDAFLEVVELRNDRGYSSDVMYDLQLALKECGETELAAMLMERELESRRDKKRREQEDAECQREFMHLVGVLASRPTSETKIDNFFNQGGTFNDNSGATFQPYSLPTLHQQTATDE